MFVHHFVAGHPLIVVSVMTLQCLDIPNYGGKDPHSLVIHPSPNQHLCSSVLQLQFWNALGPHSDHTPKHTLW